MINETVIYKGKVYEIGKYYLFSNNGSLMQYPNRLRGIDGDCLLPFFTDSSQWKFIKETTEVGTITDAPVELVDGAAYMFDLHNTRLPNVTGIYGEQNNQFYCNGYNLILSHCTNIRKMVVES